MSLDDSDKDSRRLYNSLDPMTARAVRFLASDPSFWDAIRSSWLVDYNWRPCVGAWALLDGKTVKAIAKATSDTFEVLGLDGVRLTAAADELSQARYVPWAVIKMHGIPKLAIAGVDVSKVDWEEICDRLHQHDDPTYQASASSDECEAHDEPSTNAPRA